MQIKEVSNRTGLTIKTIRFYEERGLISPKIEWRNGKNYRDYQDRDIEQLNMVAVLRKCLFSIEQIKTMLDHPELTQDVFEEYRDAIMVQRDLLTLLANKAETVDVPTLKDPETLARRLTTTASPLPLPNCDVAPNFGRFEPETPEERQAAYVKWQKRYRYRNLRWQVPLGLMLLGLCMITVLKIGNVMTEYEKAFSQMLEEFAYASTGAETVQRVSSTAYRDISRHMAYAVYDVEGNLLPEPEGNMPDLSSIPAAERKPDSPMFAANVAFSIREMLAARFYPWNIKQSPSLYKRLVDYVDSYGTQVHTVSTNPFRQCLVSAAHITVYNQPFTVVVYFQCCPILMGLGKLLMVYLGAALVWGVAFAFRNTKGYGFKVRFLRSYIPCAPRAAWNDAIISVDEKNGNATILTQQYSGMSNLVNMDYKKDE